MFCLFCSVSFLWGHCSIQIGQLTWKHFVLDILYWTLGIDKKSFNYIYNKWDFLGNNVIVYGWKVERSGTPLCFVYDGVTNLLIFHFRKPNNSSVFRKTDQFTVAECFLDPLYWTDSRHLYSQCLKNSATHTKAMRWINSTGKRKHMGLKYIFCISSLLAHCLL